MQDWQIAKATGRCAACGRSLAEGEPFYAILIDLAGRLERRDYCEDCWTGPDPQAYCFWKSRVPEKQQKDRTRPAWVDDDLLLSLFEQLDEETSPRRVQLRFILALMLMRKRRLKYQRSIYEDGQEIWLMQRAGEATVHRVVNPQLDESQIDELTEQLGAILSGQGIEECLDEHSGRPAPARTEQQPPASTDTHDAQ